MFGDGGFYVGGTFGSGSIPITGGGTRLMWYPKKAAFRAGGISSNNWDDAYVGQYSVAMGYSTIAQGNYSAAMGNNAVANGEAAISLGNHTFAVGDRSLAFGSYVSTNGHTGSVLFGDNSTSTYMYNFADNQFKMRFAGGYILSTYEVLIEPTQTYGVYLNPGDNSWSNYSDSTKKEKFIDADGEYFLSSLLKIRLGSWNYKSQDPKKFRHYGPMAQDIFHYFGKDKYGTIGCDTALSTLNMDGIMMICLKALSRRTEKIEKMKQTIFSLKEKITVRENAIKELGKEAYEMEGIVKEFSKSFSKVKMTIK